MTPPGNGARSAPGFLDARAALAHVTGRAPGALHAEAQALRRAHHGTTVTYARNLTLDLSHACVNDCGYCVFKERAGNGVGGLDDDHKDGETLSSRLLLPGAEVARRLAAARAAGCTEILVTAGEAPDADPRVARLLAERGFARFVDFVAATCQQCLDAGLLPHTNVGVVSRADLARLAPLNASMGLMVESTSTALCTPGGPHARSPSKAPARRLAFLATAGELRVPFTTGLLVGLGETVADRVETLVAINQAHARHGHVQEVIVQNFVPKPGTPMGGRPPVPVAEFLATVVAARVVLAPEISVQVPPNLLAGHEAAFLAAGVNDLGGVSPVTRDFINPANPWPAVTALRETCAAQGFRLAERLPVYPRYLAAPGWVAPAVREVINRMPSSPTQDDSRPA